MAKLRSSSVIIFHAFLYVSPIHSFLIGKKEADMFLPILKRDTRSNSGNFEELQKVDFSGECGEENCSQEELREWKLQLAKIK